MSSSPQITGFCEKGRISTTSIHRLSTDLPVVIKVVVDEKMSQEILPDLEKNGDGGFVTIQKVNIISCHDKKEVTLISKKTPYFFRRGPHPPGKQDMGENRIMFMGVISLEQNHSVPIFLNSASLLSSPKRLIVKPPDISVILSMTEKTPTCGCHHETGGMKELEKNIGHVPIFFRGLAESDPAMHEAILKLDNYIWSDRALSRKQKKLIAIAIAAAMRDDHALHAQMQGAKKLGVTMEEVEEALRVAFMLAGMPSYVYGKTEAAEIFK